MHTEILNLKQKRFSPTLAVGIYYRSFQNIF